MIYECDNNHISFSKDELFYCGMKGCGRPIRAISQTDVEWFYQISPAGLAIDKKDLRKILQDKNIPIESKRKVQAVFPELSNHRFGIRDRLVRTTSRVSSQSRTDSSFKMPIVIHGQYDGIANDEGTATIQGRQYFISNYNPQPANHQRARVNFHGVTFVIPSGAFMPVPSGGRLVDPIFEFPDGTIEQTSVSEHYIDGPTKFKGVLTANHQITTVLSNHLHPQAGVTASQDSEVIKLLVSAS